nr:translocator of the inner chloroplast membrane [Cryptomonas curvata]
MLNFLLNSNLNCLKWFHHNYSRSSTKYNNLTKKRSKNLMMIKSENRITNKEAIFGLFSILSFLFMTAIANKFKILDNFLLPVLSAKFSNKTFYQKLSQVPVFAVTNSSGQPYLANNSKGEQVGLIFFSHEDALNLLKAMQKARQVSDARIYIMGLDKAYKMVLSNATSSGIKGHQGQELKMIFRFYPNQKQVKYANSIINGFNFSEKIKNIPVFIADGLTIRKGNEDIIPVFLTKEDLDEAWSKMNINNPDVNPKPTILIGDLIKIIRAMETNNNEYSKFGFFPPKDSMEFVKKENKITPSAKIFSGNFSKY